MTNKSESIAEKKKKAVNKTNEAIKVAKKKQAFIYLGPNISGGVLQTGGVYKEKPEHLKDLFEKIPELEELFVEVMEVPRVKKELEQQGSEAYRIYQHVMSETRGGIN